MILQTLVTSSTCSTIDGVLTLVTSSLTTKTTFVPSYIRFIGADGHHALIVSVSIGALIIVGSIHHIEKLGKFGGN
jgi:hypothetical protein